MALLFLNAWSGSEIYRALCWTLVHSLWQGLILALATGVILSLSVKLRPQSRYNIFVGSLLLFLFTSCITFLIQINDTVTTTSPAIAKNGSAESLPLYDPINKNKDNEATITINNFSYAISDFLNNHASSIVTIWFVLFSLKLMKMISGLFQIQKLRSSAMQLQSPDWTDKIAGLAKKLLISRSIRLFESALIQVPVVIGWIKPLVLVPAGFLAQLPPDQLEAVLLHELAHIKRKDYLVNLVQSFAETIFFFNPGVIWVSSLIRDEREVCCDELAISVTLSTPNYVNALVSFQEYALQNSYAMRFSGKESQIVKRARRILFQTNVTLNNIEKIGMSVCLFLLLVLGFVFAKETKITAGNNGLVQPNVLVASIQETSVPNSKGTAAKDREHLNVTRQPIPFNADNSQKDTLPFKKYPENQSENQSENHSENNFEKYSEKHSNQYSEKDKTMQRIIDTVYRSKSRSNNSDSSFNRAWLSALKDLSQDLSRDLSSEMEHQDCSFLRGRLSELEIKLATPDYKPMPLPKSGNRPALSEQSRLHPLKYKPVALDYNRQQSSGSQSSGDQSPDERDSLTNAIIDDLIRAKIISADVIRNKQNFSYRLNNDVLLVNGVVQADAVFQKFKAKYIKKTGGRTTHSYTWINLD